MTFHLSDCIDILRRTPTVLENLLTDLPEPWVRNNEGPDTWSPFDIVGHLIHGEKTDWIPRARIILSDAQDKTFPVFDRFAQFESSRGRSLSDLLQEFRTLRESNIRVLQELDPDAEKLGKFGRHPELGLVTLQQLLATWVAHDLSHINQMTRVMARNYRLEAGPWTRYISILGNKE